MQLPLFIATKYFLATPKKNLIHRMSLVACFSVGLSTMALILVLSIFNGLEAVIKNLFHSFDPDIKIELKQGKYFKLAPEIKQQLNHIIGIHKIVEVIEDNVLLTYQGHQLVARIKGVSDNFTDQSPLEPFILQGDFRLKKDHQNFALVGVGIQYMLSMHLTASLQDLQVYYPKHFKAGKPITQQFYAKKSIRPGAVFAIEKHFDDNYIITPLDFATNLMGLQDQRTALEVQISPGYSLKKAKKMLKNCLSEEFQVYDSNEQHATLMRAIRIERLFVLVTFSFILLVASLNIFFILSMLVLEKRKDIGILYSLGATKRTIQSIFLLEGLFIGLSGAILGMLIAYLLTWLQEQFGLISLSMQTSIIDAYPIKRQLSDFVYTTVSVIIITLIATFRPAQLATKTPINFHL
jgi:lipoprotein-releasing system permease protein